MSNQVDRHNSSPALHHSGTRREHGRHVEVHGHHSEAVSPVSKDSGSSVGRPTEPTARKGEALFSRGEDQRTHLLDHN